MGTQNVTFKKQGCKINLFVIGVLMTFKMMNPPTDADIAKCPIVKISDPDWNPDKHHDDFNTMHANTMKCINEEKMMAHVTQFINENGELDDFDAPTPASGENLTELPWVHGVLTKLKSDLTLASLESQKKQLPKGEQ